MHFSKVLFFLSATLVAGSASAFAVTHQKIQTSIADVLAPLASGEAYRLMATADGRVYDVAASAESAAAKVKAGDSVELDLVHDRVVGIRVLESDGLPSGLLQMEELKSFVAPDSGALDYTPTPLATVEETKAIFESLDSLNGRSQCYQRAHVWAYQMWTQRSIKSRKVFLFFTQRFIRNYRYKWWFHVAPFLNAGGQETVVDPTFTDGPLEMNAWTDEFMTNHAHCPEVPTYSAYENNQEAQDCYLLKLPMYYYQPMDGEALDEKGTVISDWRQGDINHSQGARGRRRWWPFGV